MRLDRQPLTQPVDALAVDRRDRDATVGDRARQQPARCQRHVMDMVEQRFIGGIVVGRAVMPGLQRASQRAAEQHVQLLHPAADAEHRPSGLDHPPGQVERHRVAVQVERIVRDRNPAIARRCHVRSRSRQQQPVQPPRQRARVHRVCHRRHQQDGDPGIADQRRDEASRHRLDRALCHFVAAHHADHRLDRAGVVAVTGEPPHAPRPRSASCSWSAAAPARIAAVGWATTLPGGTSSSSQTLPPIVAPRPIVTRPRIVAPA